MQLNKEVKVRDVIESAVLFVVGLAILFFFSVTARSINRITEDRAIPLFAELAEVDPDQVIVVDKSNDNPWLLGNSHDVGYKLLIDGKSMSGRCISEVFSPIVCQVNGGYGE